MLPVAASSGHRSYILFPCEVSLLLIPSIYDLFKTVVNSDALKSINLTNYVIYTHLTIYCRHYDYYKANDMDTVY